jgi:rhamnopyranosyl-N-acetylglucosaminyl-diphospho-decaprenol beta-1,3/1,4-galactofuranosyltransferase
MNLSIASVTTAFNAAKVLPRQIDALLRQTLPLREIIVVDNGSTDGTVEMLEKKYPRVTVLRMAKNLGAAGGWEVGLKYAALEKGYDWVWNLDDDSVPGDSALELLVSGAGSLVEDTSVGMLAPLPVHEETGKCFPPLLWRDGTVLPPSHLLREPVWFADMVIASGCLVRREVAERAGLPPGDFFMDIFDFAYCLQVRSAGYKIAVIGKCPFSHTLGEMQEVRFFGRKRIWTEHAPWREYYWARNMTYLVHRLYPSPRARRFLAKTLLRHGCAVLLWNRRRAKTLIRMTQGFFDGRSGKLGVRFLPGKS